jgi:hypothetical protein
VNHWHHKTLLSVALLGIMSTPCVRANPTAEGKPLNIEVISREIYEKSPAVGTGVNVMTFYTRKSGGELLELRTLQQKSDLLEIARERRSLDNGRSWQDEKASSLQEKRPNGRLRRWFFPGYVDPKTGLLLRLRIEGVLPTDHPLDGAKHYLAYYTVSQDGGRTNVVDQQVIQDGTEYSATHPIAGVWTGKNALQIGAYTCLPITLDDGTILVPFQAFPLGPDGEYSNLGGGYTYTDVVVLRGRWKADKSLAWEPSQRVLGDPQKSTRGMIEPTLAQLKDGRVMMVMRGSNDRKPQLPGYKWISFSSDQGRTWSTPVPWTYDDGSNFFSPSSCSLLHRHPSGKLLWFGNLAAHNPRGNSPRHPLVVGEVDESSGLLVKNSVVPIIERGPNDTNDVQYSNFYVRQDRETGDMVLHLSPLRAGNHRDMTADAMIYRLRLRP